MSWSLGGAGVLTGLAQSSKDMPPPFSIATAFYPVCSGLQPWKANVPLLILLAGLDGIAPPAVCDTLARSVPAGPPVEVHTYPEARHSFDMSGLPAVMPSRAFAGKTPATTPRLLDRHGAGSSHGSIASWGRHGEPSPAQASVPVARGRTGSGKL